MLPDYPLAMGESLVISAVILVAALWMDKWLGEPSKFHPLVGFGWLAKKAEKLCRNIHWLSERKQGLLAWTLAVIPLVIVIYGVLEALQQISLSAWVLMNVVILYLTIGGRSLIEHTHNIFVPLQEGNIEGARYQVSMIVSRNTDKMGKKEITSSAIESVLENGNDAVFAPMLWFVLLGAPGAVLFRLANTLDAMWGYKNEKYLNFGRFTAKTDDFLGWLPARITAVTYAFQGNFKSALTCWKEQAHECSSPNGGVVMTTGAGALGITIGGPTYYHGVLHDKKPMGRGQYAKWDAISRANRLVSRGSFALSYLWLIVVITGVS